VASRFGPEHESAGGAGQSGWALLLLGYPHKGMVCAEKMRLITAYAAITERFAIAVAKLRLTTTEEFNKAFAASEAARAECAKARRAMQKHRDQHCC